MIFVDFTHFDHFLFSVDIFLGNFFTNQSTFVGNLIETLKGVMASTIGLSIYMWVFKMKLFYIFYSLSSKPIWRYFATKLKFQLILSNSRILFKIYQAVLSCKTENLAGWFVFSFLFLFFWILTDQTVISFPLLMSSHFMFSWVVCQFI